MNECWIKIFSVVPWGTPPLWLDFFRVAEEILGAKLTHLDIDDPPKRTVTRANFEQSGDFAVGFRPQENARWLFGRFKGAKVEITAHHHKTARIAERDFPNSLTIYFPEHYLDTEGGAACVERLFNEANRIFLPFYSFADLRSAVVTKKKSTGAVNLQEELLGVFWLTYFSSAYVNFIGPGALAGTGCAMPTSGGLVLKLGGTPGACSVETRRQMEVKLGQDFFVNPVADRLKPLGRHALTFAQLGAEK